MHLDAHLDIDLIALDEPNQVTCLLELTAPADEQVTARPGRTLVVVLDRSGSMNGQPLHSARESLTALVRRLAPHDCFGLVVFDDEVEVVAPVHPMADHHLPELINAIGRIDAGNSTNLSAGYLMGLRLAKESLAASGHSSATLLLISDGHANAGVVDPERMHDVARSAVTDGIITSTVGLGVGYDEVLLEALTRGGNGNHRFADTVDVAAAEIAQTVSDLLDVSVLAATLRITSTDEAVYLINIRHDVPNWLDHDSVVVSLGDLYAGEQRRLLVQLGVQAVRELGTRHIADLQLAFTQASDLSEHRVTIPVVVNVVPGDEARGLVPNPVVEVERLIVEVDEAKRSAVDSLQRRDSEEATRTLSQAISEVEAKQASAAAAAPEAAERLEATLAELRDLEESLQYQSEAYNAKLFMASATFGSRGKTNRRLNEPTNEDDEE